MGQERPGYLPISIHSPHARGDGVFRQRHVGGNISIHSPHARGDKCFHDPLIGRPISIHSPHARGDNSAAFIRNSALISIHSPHARGDLPFRYMSSGFKISIHSPHARGDYLPTYNCPRRPYFNPLPSCEGRRPKQRIFPLIGEFQSTPLMRGETNSSDLQLTDSSDFNPLPSCEGRHDGICGRGQNSYFNPLPSCEGRQHKPPKILLDSRQSIQQKHHSSFF